MPYEEPDPTDPHVLLGVALPAGAETMREMAYVLAEEFARLGYDGDAILGLFGDPFYAGVHRVEEVLGREAVRAIVEECVAAWGRRRPEGA